MIMKRLIGRLIPRTRATQGLVITLTGLVWLYTLATGSWPWILGTSALMITVAIVTSQTTPEVDFR